MGKGGGGKGGGSGDREGADEIIKNSLATNQNVRQAGVKKIG